MGRSPATLTDLELIQRCQADPSPRDDEAWRLLVDRHWLGVAKHIRGLLSSRRGCWLDLQDPDVQAATTDVFAALCDGRRWRLSNYRPARCPLTQYLRFVAQEVILTPEERRENERQKIAERRKKQQRQEVERSEGKPDDAAPEEQRPKRRPKVEPLGQRDPVDPYVLAWDLNLTLEEIDARLSPQQKRYCEVHLLGTAEARPGESSQTKAAQRQLRHRIRIQIEILVFDNDTAPDPVPAHSRAGSDRPKPKPARRKAS
jgi:hypothetical protein